MHERQNPLLRQDDRQVYNGEIKITWKALLQLNKMKVLLSMEEGQRQNRVNKIKFLFTLEDAKLEILGILEESSCTSGWTAHWNIFRIYRELN